MVTVFESRRNFTIGTLVPLGDVFSMHFEAGNTGLRLTPILQDPESKPGFSASAPLRDLADSTTTYYDQAQVPVRAYQGFSQQGQPAFPLRLPPPQNQPVQAQRPTTDFPRFKPQTNQTIAQPNQMQQSFNLQRLNQAFAQNQLGQIAPTPGPMTGFGGPIPSNSTPTASQHPIPGGPGATHIANAASLAATPHHPVTAASAVPPPTTGNAENRLGFGLSRPTTSTPPTGFGNPSAGPTASSVTSTPVATSAPSLRNQSGFGNPASTTGFGNTGTPHGFGNPAPAFGSTGSAPPTAATTGFGIGQRQAVGFGAASAPLHTSNYSPYVDQQRPEITVRREPKLVIPLLRPANRQLSSLGASVDSIAHAEDNKVVISTVGYCHVLEFCW